MELEEAIDIMYGEYIRCKDKNLNVAYMKAIIALERERPMKPYREEWIGIDGKPYDLCPNPNCRKNIYTTSNKISYCPRCGQALLWE